MTLGMTPDKRKIAPPPPNTHYSSAGLSYALTALVLSIPVSLICYITTCYLTTFPGTRATTLADTLRDSVWLFFHTVYRHPFHALWIFLLLLFTAILIWLAARELRQRSDTRTFSSFVLSVAFLVPISICFFYIFSFPTVRPKPILTASIDTLASEPRV